MSGHSGAKQSAQARILVVEDQVELAEAVRLGLTELGYRVVAVLGSGEEAVLHVPRLEPDLVLMDIELPGGIDGVEAAAQIRASHDVPIVYLTAHSEEETLQRAKLTEPFGYLIKPFDSRELRSIVEVALYKHEMAQRLQESTERFQLYYEKAPLGYQSLDANGCLVEVNPAWLEMLGYDRDEVIGRPFADYVVPHQVDLFKERFARFAATGRVQRAEYELMRGDGLLVPVSIEGRVSLDQDGSVQQIHFILHDITQRMRAEETLRQRNRELALLNRAAQAINSSLELDEVLAAVLTEAQQLLDVTACSIWLVDPETDELVCRQATPPRDELLRGWRLAPGEGLVGWTAQKRESLILADAKADERHYGGVDDRTGLETRSILSIPLQTKENVVGVLQVVDSEVNRFGLADLTLAESLAALAGTAIENAQLFVAVSRQAKQLESLRQMSQDLIALRDPGTLLQQIVERAITLLGGSCGGMYLHRPERDVLEWVVAVGAGMPQPGLTLGRGEGLSGRVWSSGEPLVVGDYESWPHRSDRVPLAGLRSVIGVPVRWGDAFLGVINVCSRNAGRGFTLDDAALLFQFATLAAAVIQNAQLYGQARREIAERKQAEEALRQRAAQLALLSKIGERIAAALDLDGMLDRAARLVQEGFDYPYLALFTLEDDGKELVVRSQAGQFAHLLPKRYRLRPGQGMAGWAARNNETILSNNVEAEPRYHNPLHDVVPIQAELCVPIRVGGEVVGVLDAQSIHRLAFDEGDVMVLETLAGQIGVAIENLRLAGDAAEVEILRELDRLRGELIANVSHELRTPLGLIKIFCTTLLRDDMELSPETRREFLLDIDDETDKLEQIVDNLLDLSRVGAGRLRLDKRPTDLGQLASQVMEAMEVHLEGHHFLHDFPAQPMMADVDPKRIEQVLRNLLSNAIKYSPDGGEITVRGRRDAGQFALIWVSDQGIGIPQEDLERVFERFYRVENEVTERVRGAGLGLAVCHSLVEAHGGRIWAESTPGSGSTFYFTLPVDEGSEPSRVGVFSG
jgi:PAS domain S-box-containing protein